MNAATKPPIPDERLMLEAFDVLFEPGQIVEMRAFPKGRKRTDCGYFDGDHRAELARAAAGLNRAGAAAYVTLNIVDPQLLGRYANRVESYASATTTDANIVRRRWMLIDLDPVRPKDTAATDEQIALALDAASRCESWLTSQGWPAPTTAESGNGIHLLYPIDLPNDEPTTATIKAALEAIGTKIDTDAIKVDRAVFNAGRITKLYGTVATKGDHLPSAPHRLSRIVSAPGRDMLVTREQLQNLLAKDDAQGASGEERRRSSQCKDQFDLYDFLERLGIPYTKGPHGGSDRLLLAHCPFNPDHGKGEAAIFRRANGALGFKCQHDSCRDRRWKDVREIVDGPRWNSAGGASSTRQSRGAAPGEGIARVQLRRASSVTMQSVDWLWAGWIARRKLHLLAGAPGTGKTTIALSIAAIVSSGGRWPDGTRAKAADVLIWSGEDDDDDTIAPRLAAMGANLDRIFITDRVFEEHGSRTFDPATDMPALLNAARELPSLGLIVLDPVVSAVSGDSHKNSEVRRGLQPVVDLGHQCGAAVLGLSHFTKGTSGRDPLERVTGSLAFAAVARLVFGTAKARGPEGDELPDRVFARLKSNLGPDGGGFNYRSEVRSLPDGLSGSAIAWGDAIEGDARTILGSAEADDDGGERQERKEAGQWLRELLAAGPMPQRDIERQAREAGFSMGTVRRAKGPLGVRAVKSAFSGGWRWSLPGEGDQPTEDHHTKTVITLASSRPPKVINPAQDDQKNTEDDEDDHKNCCGESDHLRAVDIQRARRPAAQGDHLRTVTCDGCARFIPDAVNPTGGLGACQLGKRPGAPLFPFTRRACADFRLAAGQASHETR